MCIHFNFNTFFSYQNSYAHSRCYFYTRLFKPHQRFSVLEAVQEIQMEFIFPHYSISVHISANEQGISGS